MPIFMVLGVLEGLWGTTVLRNRGWSLQGHFLGWGVQQVAAILYRVLRVWHLSGVLSASIPKMRISKHS